MRDRYLDDIRHSARAPTLEIRPDYRKGYGMSLPFLTPFLASGQFLSAECVLVHGVST